MISNNRGDLVLHRISLSIAAGLCLSISSCDNDAPPREPSARPVTSMLLEESDPSSSLRIPGIVKSWAEEDVSFEVSGRVEFIVEQGTQVEGRWVESGAVLIEGDVLARVDRAQYETAVRAAQADVERARIELERVAPTKVIQAQAMHKLRQIEHDRVQQAHNQGGATDLEVLTAKVALELADADVEAARAAVAGARAALARNQASLDNAQLDLDRSELRAPFRGEVADVFTNAGGYASAGTPVLHLVMMDPIKIDVTVSAQTNRRIATDDLVRVFVPDRDEPILGKVYQKSTAADARTRTFTVTVIVRNGRDGPVSPQSTEDMILIGGVGAAMREHTFEAGPLFVEEHRALRRDGDLWFVWAADEMSRGLIAQGRSSDNAPRFTLRRVPVVPGEHRINYQGLYVVRELADPGSLAEGQPIALDVPDSAKEGDSAQVSRAAWMVRPGDLVEVGFVSDTTARGYYMPLRAVIPSGPDRGAIFVVGDDKVARRIELSLGRVINELQHVQGDELSGLPAGTQVILDGARFLQDGDLVETSSEGR